MWLPQIQNIQDFESNDISHLGFEMADTQITQKHIFYEMFSCAALCYKNWLLLDFMHQGTIYPSIVSYLGFKMADIWIIRRCSLQNPGPTTSASIGHRQVAPSYQLSLWASPGQGLTQRNSDPFGIQRFKTGFRAKSTTRPLGTGLVTI